MRKNYPRGNKFEENSNWEEDDEGILYLDDETTIRDVNLLEGPPDKEAIIDWRHQETRYGTCTVGERARIGRRMRDPWGDI